MKMINIELQSLVTRLTPNLKSSLESAAGECVSRGHFAIELEHWFIQLLQNSTMGWQKALQQADVAPQGLIEQFNHYLAGLAKGNDASPSLSPSLVELLKDAWMIGSLNHKQLMINEFHLLMVLKQRIEQGAYNGVLSHWLNVLSS